MLKLTMNYTIVRLGGKQFNIKQGDVITVERQSLPLDIKVLAHCEDDNLQIGTPFLDNVKIESEVLSEVKVKTTVARYKSKSRYRKVKGHKQPFNQIKFTKITSSKGAK